jgi:transposase
MGEGSCKGKNTSDHHGLKRMNTNAGGIDVGSEWHYVAIPPDRDESPIRKFGCLTPDLHDMGKWLKSYGIDTIAMESTGVYWIPVAHVLEHYGIEVVLVDASHVKNVSGRKTDVQDCQWLQELHTYGLLRGAFRLDKNMIVLRDYWRQRASLVESCSRQIQLMQKAMEQMNIQLHKVISDVTGLTGMAIIREIVAGERDTVKLAQMRNARVKSSEETIVKALTGNYRQEHLFALKQSLEFYDFHQQKIEECDREIERYIATLKGGGKSPDSGNTSSKIYRRKNQPYFDLKKELHDLTGVDLTQIDGISTLTAQTVISEYGYDMSKFPTVKHFASHLGLCPDNRITGGKIKRSRTRRVKNRTAAALRVAAQSLHRSQSALGAYYRRMRSRLGAPKAITATAHKLAVIIYNMLKYGKDYVDKGQKHYEEKFKSQQVAYLKKMAKKLNMDIVPVQLCPSVS